MSDTQLPEPTAEELAHSNQLLALIREEITASGPMPFSRFMERCLYAPGLGYYSAGRQKFGADGDFVTAPELGEVFGRCLARAVAPTLTALGPQAEVLELGGGSGALAEVLLKALATRDCLPARYLMLEPSADLKERQRERLQAALPSDVFARLVWLERPPEESWQGVLLANEVIDALPCSRFSCIDGEVMEQCLTLDGSGALDFQDRPADPLTAAAVRHVERDLGRSFDTGYRTEILPQLPHWMQAVLGSLTRGAAWFIDYGYPRREYYQPDRDDGTLLAHYRQRAHADVLRWPGLQDITASVDFTALAEAGNNADFMVASYLSQAQFLMTCGLEQVHAELMQGGDAAATYALGQEVKRLTLPGQMGERFQVMVLARDVTPDALPEGLLAASRGDRL